MIWFAFGARMENSRDTTYSARRRSIMRYSFAILVLYISAMLAVAGFIYVIEAVS